MKDLRARVGSKMHVIGDEALGFGCEISSGLRSILSYFLGA